MFFTGASGFIFECVLSTVATYILGNSIEQFSVTISLMLLMMGVAGYWQKRLSDRRLIEKFLAVEVLLAMLGGFAPTAAYAAYATMENHFSLVKYFFVLAIGFLIGLEIPLVLRINRYYVPTLKSNIATVFSMDYIGSFIGALVWVYFFLKYFPLTEISFFVAGVNFFVAVITYLYFMRHRAVARPLVSLLMILLTAAALGFDRPMANSLDAVSDRDFALESLAAASICAGHLSRLAEEIVIWMTPQFGFVTLPDHLTTGSSIMPQKRNPDAAELVRAKTGRIMGSLVALSTVMKGLPLAYSKDMQEDKPPVFEAFDALDLALVAMTAMVAALKPDTGRMRAAAGSGFSTATDLADWVVRELDLPFRQAHHITGAAVKRAEALGVDLAQLPLDELTAIEPGITSEVYKVLSPEASCDSRRSYGGTAPEQVRARIAEWKTRLS